MNSIGKCVQKIKEYRELIYLVHYRLFYQKMNAAAAKGAIADEKAYRITIQ